MLIFSCLTIKVCSDMFLLGKSSLFTLVKVNTPYLALLLVIASLFSISFGECDASYFDIQPSSLYHTFNTTHVYFSSYKIQMVLRLRGRMVYASKWTLEFSDWSLSSLQHITPKTVRYSVWAWLWKGQLEGLCGICVVLN